MRTRWTTKYILLMPLLVQPKELHKGQVDKAGKDYFEGHLSYVGEVTDFHGKKNGGFLHDAAEDTDYSVKEIIRMLKSYGQLEERL